MCKNFERADYNVWSTDEGAANIRASMQGCGLEIDDADWTLVKKRMQVVATTNKKARVRRELHPVCALIDACLRYCGVDEENPARRIIESYYAKGSLLSDALVTHGERKLLRV